MSDHAQRMLLVEDNEQTRTLLRRMLTLCGWEVSEAGTVAEGLAQLDPPPDSLVLDLELPDGDGEEILRAVRAGHLPTRVVVNTGNDEPARMFAISELKPEAVLHKPLDPAGLTEICKNATVGRPGD